MAAVECRFAVMRCLDVLLGRIPRSVYAPDPMQECAALLGDVHETAYLHKPHRPVRVNRLVG